MSQATKNTIYEPKSSYQSDFLPFDKRKYDEGMQISSVSYF